jgi:hypothetical protein
MRPSGSSNENSSGMSRKPRNACKYMGVDGVLVSSTVFKTARAAWCVAGGFDSHTLPPMTYKGFWTFED